MASGLPQLLSQLDRWLRHEHDAARLRTDTETDLCEHVATAAAQLNLGGRAAHHLAAALNTAHQHLSSLATAKPDQRKADQPNQGVSFHP